MKPAGNGTTQKIYSTDELNERKVLLVNLSLPVSLRCNSSPGMHCNTVDGEFKRGTAAISERPSLLLLFFQYDKLCQFHVTTHISEGNEVKKKKSLLKLGLKVDTLKRVKLNKILPSDKV